jgi:hypothetical protein
MTKTKLLYAVFFATLAMLRKWNTPFKKIPLLNLNETFLSDINNFLIK